MGDFDGFVVEDPRLEGGNVAVTLVTPEGHRVTMILSPKALAQLAARQIEQNQADANEKRLTSLPVLGKSSGKAN